MFYDRSNTLIFISKINFHTRFGKNLQISSEAKEDSVLCKTRYQKLYNVRQKIRNLISKF